MVAIAEQWKEQGRQKGIENGRQKGIERVIDEGVRRTACEMLTWGFAPEVVSGITGISAEQLQQLKN